MSGSDLSTCQDTVSPEPHPWEAVCSWLCATHCDQPVPGYPRAAALSRASPGSSWRSPHADAGSVFLCPCWDQLSGEVTACGERLPALPSICSAEQELEDPALEWKKSCVQKQWLSVHCCSCTEGACGNGQHQDGICRARAKEQGVTLSFQAASFGLG